MPRVGRGVSGRGVTGVAVQAGAWLNVRILWAAMPRERSADGPFLGGSRRPCRRGVVSYDLRIAREDRAMLKLWGRLSSINVRKVVLTAQLLEVPFERIDAGAGFGVTKTPEYVARNPNALVPTLEDDDFVLWESNAIVRYLCAKHPEGGLYPQDLRTRFDAERWMDWQQTTLNNAGREAFIQCFRTPEDRRSAQAIAASEAATAPLLALLDAHLAQRPFMAGERLTMADIPIACEIHRWWGLPLRHAAHPHVRRWYEGLRQRPAARGALDVALS
jgi:glutathione S-transferase